MPETQKKIAIINVSVRPDQRAMLVQHAKDNGYMSLSEAMRAILDEWRRQQAREYQEERAAAGYTG